jgi:hypothetical protein
MAGTTGAITITEQTINMVKRIKFDWVTGSSSQTDEATGTTTNYYDGKLLQFQTSPDSTAAPTADYDITITDSDSVDQLLGSGADRHTTSTEILTHSSSTPLGVAIGTQLTINITNAGTETRGLAYLYIR